MRHSVLLVGLALVTGLCAVHCGSDAAGDGAGAGLGGSGGATFDAGVSGSAGAGNFPADAGVDAPPPEKELESFFRAPVATKRFVWTANPESGRVAVIDAQSYELKILEAGYGPTHLAALPGEDNAAIVLNVGSNDATLFRLAADGSAWQKNLDTHVGANSWSIGQAGKWAVVWTDAARVEQPDPIEGFQDVTVIRVVAGKEQSTELSVGYRPTRLTIAADETRAFAVTEPGISIIDLPESGEPSVVGLVEVTDDPLENPASRDVSIHDSGCFALVRRDGSPTVRVVWLDGSAPSSDITLSGDVTDLDLVGDLAVAVVRETSEVVLLRYAPGPPALLTQENLTIANELFGSVTHNAELGLLYTNAVANDHVTLLDLSPPDDYLSYRTVSVKGAVQAVFPSPDSQHAVALLSTPPGSSKQGAFALIPTQKLLSPKIVGTDAKPQSVALSADEQRALVTVRDESGKQHGVYFIRLPNLQVDFTALASAPLATGIVPLAGKGYVAQQHPEGRITFLDLSDGEARTLTGFELGAKVVE